MGRSLIATLLFACLGLTILHSAAFDLPILDLRRRVDPIRADRQSLAPYEAPKISYQALREGSFRPELSLRPIHETHYRRQVYATRLFYKGAPIYYPDPEDFDLSELQRGYADFGAIHVFGRA